MRVKSELKPTLVTGDHHRRKIHTQQSVRTKHAAPTNLSPFPHQNLSPSITYTSYLLNWTYTTSDPDWPSLTSIINHTLPHPSHARFLLQLHLRLQLERSLNSQLAQILSLEPKILPCRCRRHPFPLRRPRNGYPSYRTPHNMHTNRSRLACRSLRR